MPNLKELKIRNVPNFTTDDLEDYLSSSNIKPTFLHMKFLGVYDCWEHEEDYPPGYKTVLPEFLGLMPNLEEFDNVSYLRVDLDPPSMYDESELLQMRLLCPKLTKIRITMNACRTQDRFFWPLPFLREMACYESINELTLWVNYQVDTLEDYTTFFNYKNCRSAYMYMVFCRKSKMIAECGAFKVLFVPEVPSTWKVPHHEFTLNDRGHIESNSRKYAIDVDWWKRKLTVDIQVYNAMDDDQLVEAIAEKMRIIRSPHKTLPVKYGWAIAKRYWMIQERKRRERNSEAAKNFGEYATLLDVWSSNEHNDAAKSLDEDDARILGIGPHGDKKSRAKVGLKTGSKKAPRLESSNHMQSSPRAARSLVQSSVSPT